MKNKFIKNIFMLVAMVMVALLLVAMIDTKIKGRTFDFDVKNTYESISKKIGLSPLEELDIYQEKIVIVLDGDIHISTDKNNINTKMINPKYKFAFIGDIKFGSYELNFDADNPLVSTEIIFDGKWATFASNISTSTTTIDDNVYFLGTTVIHDNSYNVEMINLDVYDASKNMIGQYVFDVKSND